MSMAEGVRLCVLWKQSLGTAQPVWARTAYRKDYAPQEDSPTMQSESCVRTVHSAGLTTQSLDMANNSLRDTLPTVLEYERPWIGR